MILPYRILVLILLGCLFVLSVCQTSTSTTTVAPTATTTTVSDEWGRDAYGITKLLNTTIPDIIEHDYDEKDDHPHAATADKIENLLGSLVDKLASNHVQHKDTVESTLSAFKAAIAVEEAARVRKMKAIEKVNQKKAELAAAEKELQEAIIAHEKAIAALELARQTHDKAVIQHNIFVKNMILEKTLVNKIHTMMDDLIDVREETPLPDLTGTKVSATP